MLYNLLILNSNTGTNLASIKLAEEGIEEDRGILMSGIVKAIESFLNELEIGDIQTFHTQKKKIMVSKEGNIITALVCDDQDDSDLYLPKVRHIAKIFNESCNWDEWAGEIDIFDDQIQIAKKILEIDKSELVTILKDTLNQLSEIYDEIYGFEIYQNSDIVEKSIKHIDDYELNSLFSTSYSNVVRNVYNSCVDIISKDPPKEDPDISYLDYNRFSILVLNLFNDISIYIFLSGRLDPLDDITIYINKLKELSGLFEF